MYETSTAHVTPSQTVGPFFAHALPYDQDWELVSETHPGAIEIRGRVLDGAGEPLPDALLELWTGTSGPRGALRRKGVGTSGFGRCATTPEGFYHFRTVRPDGAYMALLVFARGLLRPVLTRIYLRDEPDPLLDMLEPARKATLIARERSENVYEFDVHLQGEKETVFLGA
ncbi:protocatechuate 3,4-dioxygenase subunit alpha [Sphaerisporangium siamense]|uniref:Protocatechuate 3,4-dioxygenase alpha subunit n=1 Tax=Sphaerisporangium siamense TaxID=795645 RepID=A0A7W7G6V3_9ACTN|nr:protocatechuate 3,4-dioxygenase subunit alpha [Sphaerisporangium siamense]MBB4699938.1 protocatechuate 3,4-dioxygenase alpha subunit [Sphaerisporangium siamense]GII84743.1 protocatechuate 3,4-dioxygenase subunit alpha [Sphaerisporangium siamense]